MKKLEIKKVINWPIVGLQEIIIFLIHIYQRTLSPDHGLLAVICSGQGACRFNPTCSEYSILALRKYGLFKGSIKTIKRL
ncbi:MAG: membrane protein insertion efficiency factor YidD, partial [Candidatus Aenigmarchaeota archaeon]|nr:membrane protein insertion efficiency factor YidD [Candidatus Aenigmarchaeota archaeon]